MEYCGLRYRCKSVRIEPSCQGGQWMAKEGTGRHSQGSNHQAGKDQKPVKKPDLTGKYEPKHREK